MKPIDGWRILPPHLFSSKDILPTLRATLFDENGHESIVCSEQNAIFLTKLGLFLVARSFCDFFHNVLMPPIYENKFNKVSVNAEMAHNRFFINVKRTLLLQRRLAICFLQLFVIFTMLPCLFFAKKDQNTAMIHESIITLSKSKRKIFTPHLIDLARDFFVAGYPLHGISNAPPHPNFRKFSPLTLQWRNGESPK